MKKNIFICGLVFVIISIMPLFAEPAKTITFQGKLTDSAGLPLTSNIGITFKIYDVESNGTPLWIENHSSVSCIDGIFNVELGRYNQLNLQFDKQYYLGITIGENDELTSCRKILVSAYSIKSINADTSNVAMYIKYSNVSGDTVTKSYVDNLFGIISSDTQNLKSDLTNYKT